MFDKATEILDLEAKVTSRSRQFREIPIWFPQAHGGFGDIMSTLKLAEGLTAEFPEKEVTVYFGDEHAYADLGTLHPSFNPKRKKGKLNNISVAQVSDKRIRQIMSRNVVGVFSPVAVSSYGSLERFLMDAAVNFYVEEYDGKEKVRLPNGVKTNVVQKDKSGRKHLVLPTGFGEQSAGIHIDETLTQLSTTIDDRIKRELIDKSGFGWVAENVPGLIDSDWGTAYYAVGYPFRTDSSEGYLSTLIQSFRETENWERAITLFDFSNSSFDSVEKGHYDEPFTDIFLMENGIVKKVKGTGDKYGKRAPNVNIVHVGNQDHSVFVDFLRYSQLPVGVTGDVSLSEAISLKKAFIYQAPGWKRWVFPNFIDLAPDLMEDWQDIDRVRSLFGCNRVNEEDVQNYLQLEAFYTQHRDAIHEAKDLEDKGMDQGGTKTDAYQLFGAILRAQGVKNDKKLARTFKENDFAISMSYLSREKGEEAELRVLKKRHIYGTGTGIGGHETMSRLFYDADHRAAFQRYNGAIIEEMNLAKNLANMIRTAADNFSQ